MEKKYQVFDKGVLEELYQMKDRYIYNTIVKEFRNLGVCLTKSKKPQYRKACERETH